MNQGMIDNGLNNIGISVEHVTAEGHSGSRVKLITQAGGYGRRPVLAAYEAYQDLRQDTVPMADGDESPNSTVISNRCDYIGLENFHGWSTPELGDFTMGYQSNTYDGDPLTDKIVCPGLCSHRQLNGATCAPGGLGLEDHHRRRGRKASRTFGTGPGCSSSANASGWQA
jgi:hypothetical protein